MSLYNALFGRNEAAPFLMDILGLIDPRGKNNINYPIPRFRDIYVEVGDKGPIIVLYTRQGGGNRECWCGENYKPEELTDERVPGEKHHPGCYNLANSLLAKHPLYIRDYDDDFDSTYAYFEFSIPPKFKAAVATLATAKPPREKWDELIKKLNKGDKDDPQVKRAMEVGRKIMEPIKKGIKEGKSGVIVVKDSEEGE